MFGYEGGFAPRALARLVAERDIARTRWPFLTTLDLSMVHNAEQLVTMVKDRTGRTRVDAQDDVDEWQGGYDRRRTVSEAVATGGPIRRHAVARASGSHRYRIA